MVAPPVESGEARAADRPRTPFGGWPRTRRRPASPRRTFAALVLVTIAIAVLAADESSWVAPTLIAVPLLAGAALLPMGWLVWLGAIALVGHSVAVATSTAAERALPSMLAFAIIDVVVIAGAQARTRLGVRGSRGELMLLDLRDHLTTEGEISGLPSGWRAEVVHRSANGDSFGGDFLVSVLSADERRLEITLVDVSGNGLDAATRALLLSGAFGGLLGSVPPPAFLPAANLYLLRQQWDEGFATGVHVAIDMRTGAYELGSAGHPPAVHFHAGSGTWEVCTASGPAFGLFAEAHFEWVAGELLPGDAMLLYTDGLVETPGRDISDGLDRLIGEAERLVRGGFASGADRLMTAVSDTETDDRACVLIWRR